MNSPGLIVIYHSRGAYPARLAAAIHVGTLPPQPPQRAEELQAALEALGGASVMSAEGLWAVGIDLAGHRIFALGRSSRPAVTHRAFHSMARLAAIDSASFRLHNVGPAIAWRDLLVIGLKAVGLTGLARKARLAGLRRDWRGAAGAAAEAAGDSTAAGPTATSLSGSPKIIYYCYGAAHSSITAANLHLGHLPLDRRPEPREIAHQPLFDRAENYDIGLARRMGTDEWHNGIYVLGLAGGRAPLARALVEFLAACSVPVSAYRFEDTLPHAGMLLRIGGYTSRGLGLVGIGRPLCALGVWLHYDKYAQHVRRVRLDAATPIRHNGLDTGPI